MELESRPAVGAVRGPRSRAHVMAVMLASLVSPAGAVDSPDIAACPPSPPHCVSSRNRDEARRIEPLRYRGDGDRAWAALKDALLQEPRIRVVAEQNQPRLLRAEASSLIFGFVDDLAFLDSPGESAIHVRSESRLGYWDFGVNRRRIERIRERFEGSFDRP